MVEKRFVSNEELTSCVTDLIRQIDMAKFGGFEFNRIIGIERGGLPLAKTLAKAYNIPMSPIKISYYIEDQKQDSPIVDLRGIMFSPDDVVLIVDDLVDTGDTIETFRSTLAELCIPSKVAVFFHKPQSSVTPDFYAKTTEDWIVFPWEVDEQTCLKPTSS